MVTEYSLDLLQSYSALPVNDQTKLNKKLDGGLKSLIPSSFELAWDFL